MRQIREKQMGKQERRQEGLSGEEPQQPLIGMAIAAQSCGQYGNVVSLEYSRKKPISYSTTATQRQTHVSRNNDEDYLPRNAKSVL